MPRSRFTALILPVGATVHHRYAQDAPSYAGLFLSPIVGWAAGCAVDQIGSAVPTVVAGPTGTMSDVHAVAMHVALPPSITAHAENVNTFARGDGDELTFPEPGLLSAVTAATDCHVGRQLRGAQVSTWCRHRGAQCGQCLHRPNGDVHA